MNDVSKSLNLTPDQINNLNQLTNQTQAKYRDQYSKLNGLNTSDRAARVRELNGQYNSAWNKGASGILNKNQLSRYQQLNYQYGGFSVRKRSQMFSSAHELTVGQVNGLRRPRGMEQQAVAGHRSGQSHQPYESGADVQRLLDAASGRMK